MTETITMETLPQFMMKVGFLVSTQGTVTCTLGDDIDDAKLVSKRREENPDRSEQIRADLEKNPSKRDVLVTKE